MSITNNLTKRELEVLAAMAAGETAGETGKRLETSPKTVKVQRSSVIHKLNARNAPNAVAIAISLGLLKTRA